MPVLHQAAIDDSLTVRLCGPDDAQIVHRLTQAAFGPYAGLLDPPSGALREDVAAVRRDLESYGGAIAWSGAEPVGCLRFQVDDGHMHVRRVAVTPDHQRQGIGTVLMAWAEAHARSLGLHEVTLGVRKQLPGNRAFYARRGYTIVARHRHPGRSDVTWYEMRLQL